MYILLTSAIRNDQYKNDKLDVEEICNPMLSQFLHMHFSMEIDFF